MARPEGEIRAAVTRAIQIHGPLPLISIISNIGIQATPDAVWKTVGNACRAGVLTKIGLQRLPHCRKEVVVYDLVTGTQSPPDQGIETLTTALAAWR